MGQVVSVRRNSGADVTRSLPAQALAKVQAACSFVNSEIDRVRNQTIGIAVASTFAVLLFSSLSGVGDVRVPIIIAAGITIFFFARARTEVGAPTFRAVAAKRIVAGLGSGLTYSAVSSLTLRHWAALDLFPEPCSRFLSRDEIAGRTDGVKYSLHRVRAFGNDRKGMIFEGVIIKIDIAGIFPAHTIIVPDRSGQPQIAPSSSGRKKDLVMMKNPAFEQLFSVHSTDYYEARKAVTPFLMQTMMDAQVRLDAELRLCFLNKSLYVTVAGQSPRFTQKLFAVPLTPQSALGTLTDLVPFAQKLAQVYGS